MGGGGGSLAKITSRKFTPRHAGEEPLEINDIAQKFIEHGENSLHGGYGISPSSPCRLLHISRPRVRVLGVISVCSEPGREVSISSRVSIPLSTHGIRFARLMLLQSSPITLPSRA